MKTIALTGLAFAAFTAPVLAQSRTPMPEEPKIVLHEKKQDLYKLMATKYLKLMQVSVKEINQRTYNQIKKQIFCFF